MAKQAPAYFDEKGNYHNTLIEATISDLSAILGKTGEGQYDSLAPGLAKVILEKEEEIFRILTEHKRLTNAGVVVDEHDTGKPRNPKNSISKGRHNIRAIR
jgi:hypothetical protein